MYCISELHLSVCVLRGTHHIMLKVRTTLIKGRSPCRTTSTPYFSSHQHGRWTNSFQLWTVRHCGTLVACNGQPPAVLIPVSLSYTFHKTCPLSPSECRAWLHITVTASARRPTILHLKPDFGHIYIPWNVTVYELDKIVFWKRRYIVSENQQKMRDNEVFIFPLPRRQVRIEWPLTKASGILVSEGDEH